MLYITAILIIVSKYLDCWTTVHRIKSTSDEQNPIARRLMKKYGIAKVIWGIFILTLLSSL